MSNEEYKNHCREAWKYEDYNHFYIDDSRKNVMEKIGYVMKTKEFFSLRTRNQPLLMFPNLVK